MNSGRREQEKAHREATKKAAEMRCRVCGLSPCEPCHYPRHRGSGGRFENEWAQELWVPLCHQHHMVLDRQHGVSPAAEFERSLVVRRIEQSFSGVPLDQTEW